MTIFYFTSTGNNLYITRRLNAGQSFSIPKMLKLGGGLSFEDEKIGFVFPCYFLGTPRIVAQFLKKAELRSDYFFAIMSYGNFSGAGLNHFHKVARKNGFSLSYLNEIVMADNYLPLFDMNDQKKGLPRKKIEENITGIVRDIQSGKHIIKKTPLFTRPLTLIAQHLYKSSLDRYDSRFTVQDSCNACGICAKVCPVDNIRVEEKPVFLHHCEECLGCTHHCPQNAIRVKREKSRERFVNEHIRTKDIIDDWQVI